MSWLFHVPSEKSRCLPVTLWRLAHYYECYVDRYRNTTGHEGVKYGDAATAVFWYKAPGASNYRVISGDLSVKERNGAPESPKGVPVTMGTPVSDWTLEILKAPKIQPPALPVPPVKPRSLTPQN